jgi:uncharacterized protein (DUF433 family)
LIPIVRERAFSLSGHEKCKPNTQAGYHPVVKGRKTYTRKEEAPMEQANIMDHFTVNSDVMLVKPTIRGMRITVGQLLKALANGVTTDKILDDYPELEKEDIRAAFLYASQLIDEEHVYAVGSN